MNSRLTRFLAVFIFISVVLLLSGENKTLGYYGDLVLNNKSEKADMPPVIFPHWLHRVEFKCKVCYPAIFEMRSVRTISTWQKLRRESSAEDVTTIRSPGRRFSVPDVIPKAGNADRLGRGSRVRKMTSMVKHSGNPEFRAMFMLSET
jgi:hypothetical protein